MHGRIAAETHRFGHHKNGHTAQAYTAANVLLKYSAFGDVAQLGERRVRNAKVGSSILLVSTKTHAQPFSVGRFVLVEPRMVPHSRHCACATVSGPLHQVPAVRPSFSLFLPL